MEKKVIEQKGILTDNLNIEIVFRKLGINLIQHGDNGLAVAPDDVFIQYKKATEVAKAIDPNYQKLEDERDALKKINLVHQLFIGKATELIGVDKALELLKESHQAIKQSNNQSYELLQTMANTNGIDGD